MTDQTALQRVLEVGPKGRGPVRLRAAADQEEQENADQNQLQPESTFLSPWCHRHRLLSVLSEGWDFALPCRQKTWAASAHFHSVTGVPELLCLLTTGHSYQCANRDYPQHFHRRPRFQRDRDGLAGPRDGNALQLATTCRLQMTFCSFEPVPRPAEAISLAKRRYDCYWFGP